MNSLHDLKTRRDDILNKISLLPRMRRGSITTTYPSRKSKDGTVRQAGPYFKHQCWKDGRNDTVYLSAEEYERLRPDVENYHTFIKLAEELAEVIECITLLEDQNPSEDHAEKKHLRASGRSGTQRLPATGPSKDR